MANTDIVIIDTTAEDSPPRGVKALLSTSAVEVYRPAVPAIYTPPPQSDTYEKPGHSATLAIAFNVALPIAMVLNLISAVIGYSVSSSGAILQGLYQSIGNIDPSMYVWVATGLSVVCLLATGICYTTSLDYRRESRPIKRLHALFSSFFIFLAGAALGSLQVQPGTWWAFVIALLLALLLPLLVHLAEYVGGIALRNSAEGLLQNNSPVGARGAARGSLRLRPSDRQTEVLYGLALARSGRGAVALPYLVRNSDEIRFQSPAVLAALIEIFDSTESESHSLVALEALHRTQPSKKSFERLMKRWQALGRNDEVLRELQALPARDRLQWHDILDKMIYESGDLERYRTFCREVELAEGAPFERARNCYLKLLETSPADVETHRALIEIGRRRGDADASALMLEQMIELEPARALEDRRSLITYYWSRGDRPNMLRHLYAIHEAGRASLDEKLRIVEERFTEGNFEQVETVVKSDAELRTNARALASLAHALFQRGMLEECRDAIAAVKQLQSDQSLQLDMQRLEQQITEQNLTARADDLHRKVQADPDSLSTRMAHVELLLRRRDVNSAVAELADFHARQPAQSNALQREISKLISQHPGIGGLKNFLANLHLEAGNAERAFSLYIEDQGDSADSFHAGCQKVLQCQPGFAPALMEEAQYYARHGEPKLALEYLDRYHAAGGQQTRELRELEFEAAQKNGDLQRAIAAGKQISKYGASNASIYVRLSEIASELHLLDDASDYIKQAQTLEPENQVYPAMLRVLHKKQKRAHAQELENRISQGTPNAVLLDELGDLFQELEQHSQAMTAYQKALQLEPTSYVTRAKLAFAFAGKSLFEDADEALQQIEIQPQMEEDELQVLKDLVYRCAELMEAGGEPGAALRAFRSVLRVEAGYRDVVARVERLRQRAEKKT